MNHVKNEAPTICVVDNCSKRAVPGHSMCRRDLEAFARACHGEQLADLRRKRAR